MASEDFPHEPAQTGADSAPDEGALSVPPAPPVAEQDATPSEQATVDAPVVDTAEPSGSDAGAATKAPASDEVASSGEAASTGEETDSADAADAPPSKPKRARKATKKAARPRKTKEAAPDPAEDDAVPVVDEPTEDQAAAVTAASASAEDAGEVETAASGEAGEADTAEEATAETGPTEDEAAQNEAATAETEQAEDETTEDEADSDVSQPPSLSLLFQAPDTTQVAPRRRRATAPAQQPKSAEERDDEPPAEPEETPAPKRGTSRSKGSARTSKPAAAETETDADASQAEGADADGEPQADSTEEEQASSGRRRRRGGRGRRGRGAGDDTDESADSGTTAPDSGSEGDGSGPEQAEAKDQPDQGEGEGSASSRRRRRRRRGGGGDTDGDDPPGTVTRVRTPRKERSEPTAVKGSTRLEAKKQRRREGREAGRRRTIITEAEFLARRESVERVMVVRGQGDRTQIGVLEDGVLVEHYVSRETATTMAGNVYLGRVQNVLPSMEAAFVDIGKGRNAVLYAGEVNWDAAGLEVNQAKRIENALSSGDTVLVQVTKDPIGHKGARLTSQISLPGRYLVYVPQGSMTGISRKLPDTERSRLKSILKEIVPESAGVIVRTAAEGASEEELRADVERLAKTWEKIEQKAKTAAAKKASQGGAPRLMHGEPDLTVRVIRDIFTEDFTSLVVSGDQAWSEISSYVEDVAPDLAPRLTRWTSEQDVFTHHRVSEQIAKAMDRKVWLPSGGSLVIDRTEAMTVIDVNTGKFVGSGGNLEETVTKNNIEAAEEIVRQLRLRDIGGIIVIDFIDMVLESNRDLVVRRLLECLGRDRTKHQVAEVTSLGLVQMTRKRVGSGLIEVFSEPCEHCNGRGLTVHSEPVDKASGGSEGNGSGGSGGGSGGSSRRGRRGSGSQRQAEERSQPSGPTMAQIAAAAHAAAVKASQDEPGDGPRDEADAEIHDLPQDEPQSVITEIDGDEPVLGVEVSDEAPGGPDAALGAQPVAGAVTQPAEDVPMEQA